MAPRFLGSLCSASDGLLQSLLQGLTQAVERMGIAQQHQAHHVACANFAGKQPVQCVAVQQRQRGHAIALYDTGAVGACVLLSQTVEEAQDARSP